jgi:hypothetical protein
VRVVGGELRLQGYHSWIVPCTRRRTHLAGGGWPPVLVRVLEVGLCRHEHVIHTRMRPTRCTRREKRSRRSNTLPTPSRYIRARAAVATMETAKVRMAGTS